VLRIVFLVLLFVNLAYFAWAHWIDVPRLPPVNEAIAKLPRLKLAEEVPPDQRPPAKAAEQSAADAAAACLSVGPFADQENSAHAAALLRAKGFDPRPRTEQGQLSSGYWVYISGMKTQADTDRALVTLEHSGIKDALVMPESPDSGRRVSLGLYTERSRAERRAQSVRQASGLDTEVTERKLPGTVYWVDLTPPPGTTAVPLQDLFAEGVSSRIAVQPCPAAGHAGSANGADSTASIGRTRGPANANPPARGASRAILR